MPYNDVRFSIHYSISSLFASMIQKKVSLLTESQTRSKILVLALNRLLEWINIGLMEK